MTKRRQAEIDMAELGFCAYEGFKNGQKILDEEIKSLENRRFTDSL